PALLSSTAHSPSPISTFSLHDALPIFGGSDRVASPKRLGHSAVGDRPAKAAAAGLKIFQIPARFRHPYFETDMRIAGRCRESGEDRKRTRLNSRHGKISYDVFGLNKKR